MALSLDIKSVNCSEEDALGLCGGTFEDNKIPGVSNIEDSETFGLKPENDLPKVIRTKAKALGILCRREPFVIERRLRILLLHKQSIKAFGLAWRGRSQQSHVTELEKRIDWTPVRLRLCFRRNACR